MRKTIILLLFLAFVGCAAVPIETVQINQSAIEELRLHRQNDLEVLDTLESALKSLADIKFKQERLAELETIPAGATVAEAVQKALAVSDATARALYDKYSEIEAKIGAYRNSPTLAAALRDLGAVNEQLLSLNETDWQNFAQEVQGQILELLAEIQGLRNEIEAGR